MRKNGIIKSFRYLEDMRPFRAMFIWGLSQMGSFLPMRKIGETDSLICLYDPSPVYAIHILLSPKMDIRDLSQFDPGKGEFCGGGLFKTVSAL